MPFVRDPFGRDPLDFESRGIGVAAGGERFEKRAEESFLGESSLRLSQHDVGRNEAFVLRAFEEREDRADTRIRQPFARRMRRLHQVSRSLMPVIAMGHAPDKGVFVGLLGQGGEQFADLDSIHIRRDRLQQVAHVIAARIRLRIPGVVVGHPAPKENLDDGFGLGFE